MIRVAALTSGANVPSSRFRVRQFIEPLREFGIQVTEFPSPVSKYAAPVNPRYGPAWTASKALGRLRGIAASRFADVCWIERELLPGRAGLEAFSGRARVFDVDDAIWLAAGAQPGFALEIAASSRIVMAGNEYIAEYFRPTGVAVHVVPTAVDTDRWHPGPDRPSDSEAFVVGWTGSASTLVYLESIQESLGGFLHEHPKARLRVVSDVPPKLPAIDRSRVEWVKWQPGIEADVVREMDVGLMPLPDDEWSRGKCALKMLQYMAAGVPTLASPVGVAADLIGMGAGAPAGSDVDWYPGLRRLRDDADFRRAVGRRGREVALAHYSRHAIAPRIADALRSAAGLDG